MAETSCCDNRGMMGLEWSLPRLSFPLPNTHPLVQPGKTFGDSRLSFNLSLYGSSELPMQVALEQFQTWGGWWWLVRGRECSLPLTSVLQSQLYFAWVDRQSHVAM